MYLKRFNVITRSFIAIVATLTVLLATSSPTAAQKISDRDRDNGRNMLSMIQLDIEKHYYDPTFHGIDLKARVKLADERIKQAKSNGEIFGIIAQVLLDFDDSHLFFSAPPRATDVNYGWQMQMVGDKCFISAVQPGSDAEKKGLKPGDQVLDVDGFQPTRDIMWKILYLYYQLKPRAGVRMTVAAPDGEQRKLEIAAKIKQKNKQVDLGNSTLWAIQDSEAYAEGRLNRDRFAEVGDELFIWKMPGFDEYENDKVDSIMAQAKKHKSMIIDLRGNGGGFVVMLQRLVGNVIDHEIKIFDEKRRKETKELKAKSRGAEAYKGRIVVIVDSRCGSAAEIFPRVMQLEKRAIVIGDRTAGAVMESLFYRHTIGVDVLLPYGASITIADLIMTDGKSLEHVGVIPDEMVLPTAADLAAGRDPVMARAAAILGIELSPEKAGTLFPIEWRK